MNRNDQNKNPVFWEQNPIIYNDEDNAPMRDDGRYPYRLRTWAEVQEGNLYADGTEQISK